MIRKAQREDLPALLEIYAQARRFMAEQGNASQWAGGFPPRELLEDDIERGQLYAVEREGRMCGAFAFAVGPDETYAHIEQGTWLSDSEYGTIHCVAGDGTAHGILREIVAFCGERISHLRIDTHRDNRVMRHLIPRNGFQECGIIYVRDGSPRIAYEKL